MNLMNNLDRMKLALWQEEFVPALVAEALRLIDEDKQLCDAIAKAGSALVNPGSRLLTHCNTGGLATAGVGTALGVIARAHQEGNVSNVWVDETRPLLQGGRLTAWELGELGVPYQLITDSMAASLMAKGGRRRVGGRRPYCRQRRRGEQDRHLFLAVLAKFHGIPSTSPRRIPRSTRPARTGTRSPSSSVPPAKSRAWQGALARCNGRRKMHGSITRPLTLRLPR